MWGLSFLVALLAALACLGQAVPVEDEPVLTRVARQQPIYGITHLDIRDAILTLEKSIKDLTDKLNRHEAREAQVAQYSTQKLDSLGQEHGTTESNMQAIARQLAMMEERLLSTEALVQTTDERQRMMLNQLSQGLDRLLAKGPQLGDMPEGLPALPQGGDEGLVVKLVKKLTRKVNNVDTIFQREIKKINSGVQTVGESLEQHMEMLEERHELLSTGLSTCQTEAVNSIQQLSATVAATTDMIQEQMQTQGSGCGAGDTEVTSRLDSLDRHYREQEEEIHVLSEQTHKSLEDHLATLKTLLEESHAGQAVINASIASLARNLSLLDNTTVEGLGHFSFNVTNAVRDSAATVAERVSNLSNEMKQDTSNIMDVLDDRASQTETLQLTVLENYSELSSEISSLKRVEQVMINTADSVLDTKRSIEFGIQQIILELGEIVKNSGSTINTTLSDQISNISFAILKNQTSALTNMTAKMEKEISQVWRQIGIMYQQMSQSVQLLDQLKDTTKEHMNASLSRVGNMDGTVDKISTKVTDVEDNLNYLLGRLSLVVSEFNLMKAGVGDELTRLRENLAKENTNAVHFAEGEPSSENRYEVNRKRHAIQPQPYPGFNPEPINVF